MRYAFLALVAAATISGAAIANDYIVVKSDDPNIPVSAAFSAGATAPLARGATLTLMSAAGEVITLTGSADGAVLPGAATSTRDRSQFAALRALVSRPPTRRAFGALRSGADCPDVAELTTIDAILLADEEECEAEAKEALDLYLARAGGSPAPVSAPAPAPASVPASVPAATPVPTLAPAPEPEAVTPEAAVAPEAVEPEATVQDAAVVGASGPEAPVSSPATDVAPAAPTASAPTEGGKPKPMFYTVPKTPAVEAPAEAAPTDVTPETDSE